MAPPRPCRAAPHVKRPGSCVTNELRVKAPVAGERLPLCAHGQRRGRESKCRCRLLQKVLAFILFCCQLSHLNCKHGNPVRPNKPPLPSPGPGTLNRDCRSSNPISIYFILKILHFWPPIFRSPIGFCFHKWIFPQSWQKIDLISNFSKLK